MESFYWIVANLPAFVLRKKKMNFCSILLFLTLQRPLSISLLQIFKIFARNFTEKVLRSLHVEFFFAKNRSSRTHIDVLKCFANLRGKYLCWSLFLNKLQAKDLQLVKKRHQHRCFPMKFTKFLQTISGGCFWKNKPIYKVLRKTDITIKHYNSKKHLKLSLKI